MTGPIGMTHGGLDGTVKCMYVCVYVYIHTCIYIVIRICITCLSLSLSLSLYIYLSLSLYVCIYIHIYIYVYPYYWKTNQKELERDNITPWCFHSPNKSAYQAASCHAGHAMLAPGGKSAGLLNCHQETTHSGLA